MNYEAKYNKLKAMVKRLLEAQKSFFKTKDKQTLMICKSYEKSILKLISEEDPNSTSFDEYLAK